MYLRDDISSMVIHNLKYYPERYHLLRQSYIQHYQIIENLINLYYSNKSIPGCLALKRRYISTYGEAVVAVHKVVKQALKGRNKLFRPFRAVVAFSFNEGQCPSLIYVALSGLLLLTLL